MRLKRSYREALIVLMSSLTGALMSTVVGLAFLSGEERIKQSATRRSEAIAAYAKAAWGPSSSADAASDAQPDSANMELLRTISQLTIFGSENLVGKISEYQMSGCADKSDNNCRCLWSEVVAQARVEAGEDEISASKVSEVLWGQKAQCGK